MGDGNINQNYARPSLTPYIVCSIVQLLCCNSITGVIALVFSLIARDKFSSGDTASGSDYMKYAKWTLIIGFILAAIIWILAICYIVFIVGVSAVAAFAD